ncbi:MAG: PhnD/SsuA/transferrin family substrate-binding protein [Pseudonocardia sp.]|nr:PhnD/SsuA/transferrin family substrate-binding protein [Pseudonocardia sp.]
MTSTEPLLVGAVAYSANVVPIWEGIRDYFRSSGAEMDFVLFSNYGRQVDALLAGTIDIAWNTNLAWARTVAQTDGACRALAMRDTGRSELDALRAVLEERADAAAIGINTWEAIGRGELMPGAFEVFWASPTYSHCNFTALPRLPAERVQPWVEHLLAMDWDNQDHRPVLEMEGLRRWVLPPLDGYTSLFEAIHEQKIPSHW